MILGSENFNFFGFSKFQFFPNQMISEFSSGWKVVRNFLNREVDLVGGEIKTWNFTRRIFTKVHRIFLVEELQHVKVENFFDDLWKFPVENLQLEEIGESSIDFPQ